MFLKISGNLKWSKNLILNNVLQYSLFKIKIVSFSIGFISAQQFGEGVILNNNISNNLDFRAALQLFGTASYHLVEATVKAPFSGGWQRLVFAGLPVLLLTSGTGFVIFSIMARCIRAAGSALYSAANKIYKDFYSTRSVTPLKPDSPRPPDSKSNLSRLLRQPQHLPEPSPSPIKMVPSEPLPIEAARERNKSLLKLLALVEKHVIDPLVKKKELLSGISYSEKELKSWLMSMTLWRLGILWDQLESQYVQMKAPPVSTVESIILQAEQIDAKLGEVFQQNAKPASPSEVTSDERILAIYNAIMKSELSETNKLSLVALHFKLEPLLKGSTVGEGSKMAEEKEIRKQFALTMNQGMADTITYMSGIIGGWVTVLKNPSVTFLPILPPSSQSATEDNETQFSVLVKDIFNQVQENLTRQYLVPLWDKKYDEWDKAVDEALKPHTHGQIELFNKFMNGKIDEKTFLEDPESQSLSTSLISTVFFMRSVRRMGSDSKKVATSTENILAAIFAQLHPTMTDVLTKSSSMLSQVSLERTVPKMFDYFIELLKHCETMQKAQETASKSESNQTVLDTSVSSPFILALKKMGVNSEDFSDFDLPKDTLPQISGKEVIKDFPEGSIHKAVRRGLDSPLHEQEWIQFKKVQLKTILSLGAEKYARIDGSWLDRFLKSSSKDQPKNLVGLLIAFSAKLRDFPALKDVMTFLFSGIESVLENKATSVVQSSLDELTSTGHISTTIATYLVKGLISKEQSKWKENLPTLQQAYLFLQPEEKKLVLKHLEAMCDPNTFEQRRQELKSSKFNSQDLEDKVEKMKKRENAYQGAMNRLFDALKGVDTELHKEDFSLVTEAFEKLKREKELQQFYRMRMLATTVAAKYLESTFLFFGGDTLKSICIQIIHEILTLLTCQELVKHWIYTIIDLVFDELEESSKSKPKDQNSVPKKAVSLLDLIPPVQRQKVLTSLTKIMETAEKDNGWLSTNWLVAKVSNWSSNIIWSYIEPHREKLTITSSGLRDKIVESVGNYGKDPNGLSDLINQVLTEHVADPRPNK